MSFEHLLNKRMTEEQIFDETTKVLLKHFEKYKDVQVCLLLSEFGDDGLVAITDMRFCTNSDKDQAIKAEFLFKGPLRCCYVHTRFQDGHYFHELMGHFLMKSGCIYTTGLQHVHFYKHSEDRALSPLPDFKFLAEAFSEIESEFTKKSS